MAMMLLGAAGLLAQQEYHVKVFGRTDELDVRGSLCIAQMNGFIWVGTSSGLIAFDGQHTPSYQLADEDGFGSYYGRVKSMVQSADGTIWVGTRRGLCIFDIRQERLLPFHVQQLPAWTSVSFMQFDNDGHMWALVGNQAYMIDVQEKKAMLVGEGQVYPSCMMVARDGMVWMGDSGGRLFRYDARNRRLRSYRVCPEGAERFGVIVSITEMGTGELALVSGDDGVCLFSPETFTSRMLLTHDDTGKPIAAHMGVTTDGDDLWIGTENGVLIYRISDGSLNAIREKHGAMNSLADNAVHTLFVDNDQGVWLGTFFGGIHRVSLSPQNFSVFQPENESDDVDVVREICQDRLGRIWVGTEDGGLYMLDKKEKRLRVADVDWGSYPHPFNVQSLMMQDDLLWVSSMISGIYVIDTKSMQVVRRYEKTSENAMGVPLHAISMCRQGSSIFICSGTSVYVYDKKEDLFRLLPELSDISAHHLYADRHGNVWVASFDKGLWKISRGKDGKWKGKKTPFAYQTTSVVMEDSRGQYWVGTELHGVMCYDDKTGKTTPLMGSKSLPHQIVTSITEDHQHRLWIGTFDGLYSYNLDKRAFMHMNTSHGLPTRYMNYSAGFVDKDGMVYVGTYKGLVRLDPSTSALSLRRLKPYFLSIRLNGKYVLPGDATGILKETLYQTKEVMLTYEQNSFTITYATPVYRNMGVVWYRYRFNPDEPWVMADASQTLQVNNLAPGKYRLQLQTSLNPDVWDSEPEELIIRVAPPVWLSTGAILGYVLVIVLIVVSVMMAIRRHEEGGGHGNGKKKQK